MLSIKRMVVIVAAAGACHVVAKPSQAQVAERCVGDDALGLYNAFGRNAWARKCGHINLDSEGDLNRQGMYVIFVNACAQYPNVPAGSTCKKFAPYVESAPCVAGLVKLAACYAGCYTPTQEVTFGGEPVPIGEAYSRGVSTVSALTLDSSREAMFFQEQPIRTFVAGETTENVFLLEALDGRRLEVTSEHPMVNWLGDIVRARTLVAGDLLLGDDGNPIELISVSQFQYQGTVWNVMPASREKLENIVNASGFLSGSVRFQNEWAEESYRLYTRDELDVSGL